MLEESSTENEKKRKWQNVKKDIEHGEMLIELIAPCISYGCRQAFHVCVAGFEKVKFVVHIIQQRSSI